MAKSTEASDIANDEKRPLIVDDDEEVDAKVKTEPNDASEEGQLLDTDRDGDKLASASPKLKEKTKEDAAAEHEEDEPEPDPRFQPPAPSPYKRAALILFTIVLFWVALSMRMSLVSKKKPEVIYASRYSKEHKYRPAASPIVTETLKDGRIRIHGAAPTASHTAAPTPKKRTARRKVKKGSTKKARKPVKKN